MFTQNQFKELQEIVSKHTTDDIIVTAIPKTIRNSGKDQDVIEIGVFHKTTMKNVRFVYREQVSNLRGVLRKAIDGLVDTIHREIVLNPPKTESDPGFL